MIKQTTLWRLFGLLVLLYVLTVLAVKKGKEGFQLSVQSLKQLNPPGCPCKRTMDCASFRCRKGKCANVFGVVPRYGDPVCYQKDDDNEQRNEYFNE